MKMASNRWVGVCTASGCRPGCHSALDDRPNMVASLNRDEPARAEPELPISQAAQACFVTAEDLAASGHDEEAIKLYERARQYNPKLTQCGHRLALCYERSGKYAEALAEYQKALKVSPKDASLLNDFGFFYLQRGNLDEAEKALRASVASDPKCLQAWANLGLLLGYRERYGEAYEAIGQGGHTCRSPLEPGRDSGSAEKSSTALAPEFQQGADAATPNSSNRAGCWSGSTNGGASVARTRWHGRAWHCRPMTRQRRAVPRNGSAGLHNRRASRSPRAARNSPESRFS